MNKFEEFMAAQKNEPATQPKGELVGGSFQCQTCYEWVEEAEYFMFKRILKWQCSEKHVSYIEDFIV